MDWLVEPLQRFLWSLNGIRCYLSGLKDPGEGEIKMITWLRQNKERLAHVWNCFACGAWDRGNRVARGRRVVGAPRRAV